MENVREEVKLSLSKKEDQEALPEEELLVGMKAIAETMVDVVDEGV